MAIESLRDWVFSSKSDVWAFGVVLWEIFSLAKVPYAGLVVDDEFICRLENGYRMNKPVLAPNFIGRLMSDCWKLEPHQRPTFGQLAESLGVYIEGSVCANYLLMDDKQRYIEMNRLSNIENYLSIGSSSQQNVEQKNELDDQRTPDYLLNPPIKELETNQNEDEETELSTLSSLYLLYIETSAHPLPF